MKIECANESTHEITNPAQRDRAPYMMREHWNLLQLIILAPLLLLAATVGVDGAPAYRPSIAAAVPAPTKTPATSLIRALLDSRSLDRYLRDRSEVRRFYENRNFMPAWAAASDATVALAILEASDADGLDPNAYRVDAVALGGESSPGQNSAEFDIVLTNAMLAYIHDMRGGRLSPDRVGFIVRLPSLVFDASAILSRTLADHALASLPSNVAPPHPEYARLKKGELYR